MNNFQRIIKDLRLAGWTQVEIAGYVGCTQPNIARIIKESNIDPRWSTGDALIRLHKKVKNQ